MKLDTVLVRKIVGGLYKDGSTVLVTSINGKYILIYCNHVTGANTKDDYYNLYRPIEWVIRQDGDEALPQFVALHTTTTVVIDATSEAIVYWDYHSAARKGIYEFTDIKHFTSEASDCDVELHDLFTQYEFNFDTYMHHIPESYVLNEYYHCNLSNHSAAKLLEMLNIGVSDSDARWFLSLKSKYMIADIINQYSSPMSRYEISTIGRSYVRAVITTSFSIDTDIPWLSKRKISEYMEVIDILFTADGDLAQFNGRIINGGSDREVSCFSRLDIDLSKKTERGTITPDAMSSLILWYNKNIRPNLK